MQSLVSQKQGWLSWFLKGVLILGFLLLLGRLGELQIIKGDYFKTLSEGNRIRKIPIPAPRGKILARGGEELVGVKPIKRRIIFDPNLGYLKSDDLEGAGEDEIITDWIRDYKLGKSFGHGSGYLGAVGPDEVGKIDPQCTGKGPRKNYDLLGRGGLEEAYNCALSGVDGEELIEVNTAGKKVRTIGRREPIAGEDIRTTVDINLQKKVYEVLEERKGAVVISDPKGEILALVSSPSFDPNDFLDSKDPTKVTRVLNDPNFPLFNRAIGGLFHPGSVFKPVVAIAALEEGKINKDFTYVDTGIITVNDFSYTNWYFTQYGGTEGQIDLTRALARSTDTFFYKIGEMLGVNKIVEWSDKFGLSEKTGIDIPGEISGLVPTPAWKQEVKGEQWFLGNTYHFSIGQGDLALTPIEINRSISGIANGGVVCAPHFIKSDNKCKDLKIKKENLSLVKEGMREACEIGGTAFTFFDFDPKVACKTGTAETGVDEKTHAWFTLFAPIDEGLNPEIVVTVLIEAGGEGSSVAGPIARSIMDFWKNSRP